MHPTPTPYQRYTPFGDDVCVYCGDQSETVDYIAPREWVERRLQAWATYAGDYKHALLQVPACRDCAALLHGYVARNLKEKRGELKRRLRAKHRALLGEYDWTPEEIAEHGYALAAYLRSFEDKRAWLLQRLGFPQPNQAET